MSSKRFVDCILAMLAIAFTSIIALNFIVNPYAQYPSTCIEPLVQTSRSTKLELLSEFELAPEGLVLGSSRVLKYEPEYLAGKFGHDQFFNAGVNYAKPEDHLAMLRHFHEHFGAMPKTVVIGLDVHGFNDNLPTDARLLNNQKLLCQIKDAVPFKERFQSLKELLSWKQTKSSVDSIKRLLKDDASDGAHDESFQDDGLIVYHTREQQIAEGKYDFDSAMDYSKREYKQLFNDYGKLSRKRIEFFLKTVDACRASGTRVIVFLTPMHPELAEYLDGTTTYLDRRDELVALLSSQAQRREFGFSDLSELETFDGEPSLFVDGIHPLESNTRRIIDRLVKLPKAEARYAVQ